MSQLLIQFPDGEEQIVSLPGGETFTLGRDARQSIAIDDRTVSRLHARLTCREDGSCLLEDLQSFNGTMLNETPVKRPEPLQDGDRLSFGQVKAIYLVPATIRPPAREFAVGDLLAGRYRLERSLGETDEYETFCAVDLNAKRASVAATIFAPGTITDAGGFVGAREQFKRIGKAPHPGMVELLDFARWRGNEYLVGEWIAGPTVLDLLRRRHGALELSDALRLAGQVAAVTDHTHAHGLPAPDLAPRAVLLSTGVPLPPGAAEQTLDAPVERWMANTVKIIPRLFAHAAGGLWPLGMLLCDLLGYPPTRPGVPPPSRIASLGEKGSELLARGFAAGREGLGGDARFVAELAQAVGLPFQEADVQRPTGNGGLE